ncbi:diaminopimelate epimerase [Mailhella massiliensis]|uniref:Diaminopimelate epimerase n=1 Tax=Mailhella massiliensis TaxID=1903261 RepID=A0A921AUT3_9BACT|nr:diaminopimelate epimerase [Mailhella massiliensis]HJD96295.1 diaminopimelate epimerase [Mailhella massiliensis]
MKDIHFHKMHGCGNDFIFIDNREAKVSVPEMASWTKTLCHRKTGIGADGLLFLDRTPEGRKGDFIWHFYNADGSRAEMCGNASRCASWLAVDLGLAGRTLCFGTDAGIIHASVDVEHMRARVELTRPQGMALHTPLEVEGKTYDVHFVNTGVPHAVLLCEDCDRVDVEHLGRLFRYHEHFAPKGTNVNFVTVTGRGSLHVRTYERGVEGETLACGTGAAASTCIAHALGLTDCSVNVTTSGKELLGIELVDGSVFLSGAVARVFTGVLDPSLFSLLKF